MYLVWRRSFEAWPFLLFSLYCIVTSPLPVPPPPFASPCSFVPLYKFYLSPRPWLGKSRKTDESISLTCCCPCQKKGLAANGRRDFAATSRREVAATSLFTCKWACRDFAAEGFVATSRQNGLTRLCATSRQKGLPRTSRDFATEGPPGTSRQKGFPRPPATPNIPSTKKND